MDKAESDIGTLTKDAPDRPSAWCSDLQPVDENVCNHFVSILLHLYFFVLVVVSSQKKTARRSKSWKLKLMMINERNKLKII